ncbi:MAG: PadR family transcriptional regulator [Aeromicrobium erythreum]
MSDDLDPRGRRPHPGRPHPRRPDSGRRGPRRDGDGTIGRDMGWDLGRELGPGFGFGPAFGHPGRRRGRRGRGRGGDVRAAVLLLLAEQPRHGYDLIREIAERSEGAWTPSPGSVYPVLQQLEDEGLLEFERVDGRKTASLTQAGRDHVEEHRDDLGTPWESGEERGGDDVRAYATALKSFLGAWKQVAQEGTPGQREQATAVVTQARKDLYRILAEDA